MATDSQLRDQVSESDQTLRNWQSWVEAQICDIRARLGLPPFSAEAEELSASITPATPDDASLNAEWRANIMRQWAETMRRVVVEQGG